MVSPLGVRILIPHSSGRSAPAGRRPPPRRVVLLTEQEHGVRARIVLLDADTVPDGWTPAAVDLLTRHTRPLELIIGGSVMRLLAGVELLDILRRVQPSVPVLLVSAARWQRAGRVRADLESEPVPGIPFDAEIVISYLEELQRLADAA